MMRWKAALSAIVWTLLIPTLMYGQVSGPPETPDPTVRPGTWRMAGNTPCVSTPTAASMNVLRLQRRSPFVPVDCSTVSPANY